MLLNCGVGEDSWESLGLQGYQISQLKKKSVIGRTDAEAPILWPPDLKSQPIGNDPDAGKDWRQAEKGKTRMDDITGLMDMSFSKLWELVRDRKARCAAVHGVTKSQTWESYWTDNWMGPDAMIFVVVFFLMFSFKPTLSLFSLTLIKRLFSSSSLSAIRVVSSTYLRFLMFLLPILIPACNSSSLAFLMMCLVYRLNKQGDSRQPCHTPFSILNQSIVPYRVLLLFDLHTGFSRDR